MSGKPSKILVITLYTFSLTGGIEKVCRSLIKALHHLYPTNLHIISMADQSAAVDERYIERHAYTACANAKVGFFLRSCYLALRSDLVFLSHVHLLPVALIVKKLRPKTKFVLLAHGIEVWRPLANWKKKLLRTIDIWAVSRFTKSKMVELHQLDPVNISVQHNCLDPFFAFPDIWGKPKDLLVRYGIEPKQPIIFSLCRLSSAESYKGYDQVIKALPALIKQYPNLQYLIAGKADAYEENRLIALAADMGVTKHLRLLGFITDQEVTAHYQLADVFALPSTEEGFGLVFIESAACGCIPLAGNQDGSADALLDGDLGKLVDPLNVKAIELALSQALANPLTLSQKKELQTECVKHFGFETYQKAVSGKVDAGLSVLASPRPSPGERE